MQESKEPSFFSYIKSKNYTELLINHIKGEKGKKKERYYQRKN